MHINLEVGLSHPPASDEAVHLLQRDV